MWRWKKEGALDKLDVLKTQVEKGSEYSEIVSWIEKSLKNYNSKIADLKKSVAAMSGKSIIFNESRFVQNRLFI